MIKTKSKKHEKYIDNKVNIQNISKDKKNKSQNYSNTEKKNQVKKSYNEEKTIKPDNTGIFNIRETIIDILFNLKYDKMHLVFQILKNEHSNIDLIKRKITDFIFLYSLNIQTMKELVLVYFWVINECKFDFIKLYSVDYLKYSNKNIIYSENNNINYINDNRNSLKDNFNNKYKRFKSSNAISDNHQFFDKNADNCIKIKELGNRNASNLYNSSISVFNIDEKDCFIAENDFYNVFSKYFYIFYDKKVIKDVKLNVKYLLPKTIANLPNNLSSNYINNANSGSINNTSIILSNIHKSKLLKHYIKQNFYLRLINDTNEKSNNLNKNKDNVHTTLNITKKSNGTINLFDYSVLNDILPECINLLQLSQVTVVCDLLSIIYYILTINKIKNENAQQEQENNIQSELDYNTIKNDSYLHSEKSVLDSDKFSKNTFRPILDTFLKKKLLDASKRLLFVENYVRKIGRIFRILNIDTDFDNDFGKMFKGSIGILKFNINDDIELDNMLLNNKYELANSSNIPNKCCNNDRSNTTKFACNNDYSNENSNHADYKIDKIHRNDNHLYHKISNEQNITKDVTNVTQTNLNLIFNDFCTDIIILNKYLNNIENSLLSINYFDDKFYGQRGLIYYLNMNNYNQHEKHILSITNYFIKKHNAITSYKKSFIDKWYRNYKISLYKNIKKAEKNEINRNTKTNSKNKVKKNNIKGNNITNNNDGNVHKVCANNSNTNSSEINSSTNSAISNTSNINYDSSDNIDTENTDKFIIAHTDTLKILSLLFSPEMIKNMNNEDFKFHISIFNNIIFTKKEELTFLDLMHLLNSRIKNKNTTNTGVFHSLCTLFKQSPQNIQNSLFKLLFNATINLYILPQNSIPFMIYYCTFSINNCIKDLVALFEDFIINCFSSTDLIIEDLFYRSAVNQYNALLHVHKDFCFSKSANQIEFNQNHSTNVANINQNVTTSNPHNSTIFNNIDNGTTNLHFKIDIKQQNLILYQIYTHLKYKNKKKYIKLLMNSITARKNRLYTFFILKNIELISFDRNKNFILSLLDNLINEMELMFGLEQEYAKDLKKTKDSTNSESDYKNYIHLCEKEKQSKKKRYNKVYIKSNPINSNVNSSYTKNNIYAKNIGHNKANIELIDITSTDTDIIDINKKYQDNKKQRKEINIENKIYRREQLVNLHIIAVFRSSLRNKKPFVYKNDNVLGYITKQQLKSIKSEIIDLCY
ncbi:hypothetical protein EDEG_00271 [Edhazardia aedis USNM 41457]|uniref:Uncharacterized protein n=1 Tax=Edhazardia aedis (strain USNM 41457) TaxID=1003232 RepID=J9DML2_EDHAE|nr:hypothetical protein EDEG_00271 [Edhazardia aedis USNM 41457]|eukprot:EJW02577.1 hypothetical protein EDEG_00271 [Edhazardia aedis USNM 41457]